MLLLRVEGRQKPAALRPQNLAAVPAGPAVELAPTPEVASCTHLEVGAAVRVHSLDGDDHALNDAVGEITHLSTCLGAGVCSCHTVANCNISAISFSDFY